MPTLRIGRRRAAIAAGIALACVGAMGGTRAVHAAACDLARVTWPTAGASVAGVVAVYGSAALDGFQFYKVEYAAAAAPESWAATSDVVRTPARHGRLDRWTSTDVPDGTYRLKLTLVDTNAQEQCRAIVEGVRVANGRGDAEPAPITADVSLDARGSSVPAPWPTAPGQRSAAQVADTSTSEPSVDSTSSDANASAVDSAQEAVASAQEADTTSAAPTVVQRGVVASEPVTATDGVTTTGGISATDGSTEDGNAGANGVRPAATEAVDAAPADSGTGTGGASGDAGADGTSAAVARFGRAFALGFVVIAGLMVALRRRLFRGAGAGRAPGR
ncbi:MAG: hypothetical protein ABI780_04665 [Ardenticatenales bacterium]